MINTNCQECIYASKVIADNIESGCSKNIIAQIKNYKTITQNNDKFNIINDYTCRYGFSKKIYEANKDELLKVNFEDKLSLNSKIRLYLLLDCSNENIEFDNIITTLKTLDIMPNMISFMCRKLSYRPFNPELHTTQIDELSSDLKWKVHNFLMELDIQDSIDHILSTNASTNNTHYFLVYDSKDIDSLNQDITTINQQIILYQNPHIALCKNTNNLFGLSMSFVNYKVAKNIDHSILTALEPDLDKVLLY